MSLALQGSFVHHLRYPWTPDKTRWRADEHERYESPSVLVIGARHPHHPGYWRGHAMLKQLGLTKEDLEQ
jgi:hypothetical protein